MKLSYPLVSSPEAKPDYTAINAAFQAMTPAEKRHAIARDVLARIEMGQLIAKSGAWVHIPSLGVLQEGQTQDLQTVAYEGARCQCCAIGAAIVGLAAMENNITVHSGTDGYYGAPIGETEFWAEDVKPRMLELFGETQIGLIERAFEGYSAITVLTQGYLTGVDVSLTDAAIAINSYLADDSQVRLFRIWQSIADHPKGLFDPIVLLTALKEETSTSPETP